MQCAGRGEVNPAMEPLRPMAAQMHAEALDVAMVAGRAFGVAGR